MSRMGAPLTALELKTLAMEFWQRNACEVHLRLYRDLSTPLRPRAIASWRTARGTIRPKSAPSDRMQALRRFGHITNGRLGSLSYFGVFASRKSRTVASSCSFVTSNTFSMYCCACDTGLVEMETWASPLALTEIRSEEHT